MRGYAGARVRTQQDRRRRARRPPRRRRDGQGRAARVVRHRSGARPRGPPAGGHGAARPQGGLQARPGSGQREERTQQMRRCKAGDERNLPARDRGPVRKYARDLVDARRSVAEFFLPFALVILVLSFTGNEPAEGDRQHAVAGARRADRRSTRSCWRSGCAAACARACRTSRPRASRAYALMRSMQIRRFRLPPPRVRPAAAAASRPPSAAPPTCTSNDHGP